MHQTLVEKPTTWHKPVAQARQRFDEASLLERGESILVRQFQPV